MSANRTVNVIEQPSLRVNFDYGDGMIYIIDPFGADAVAPTVITIAPEFWPALVRAVNSHLRERRNRIAPPLS